MRLTTWALLAAVALFSSCLNDASADQRALSLGEPLPCNSLCHWWMGASLAPEAVPTAKTPVELETTGSLGAAPQPPSEPATAPVIARRRDLARTARADRRPPRPAAPAKEALQSTPPLPVVTSPADPAVLVAASSVDRVGPAPAESAPPPPLPEPSGREIESRSERAGVSVAETTMAIALAPVPVTVVASKDDGVLIGPARVGLACGLGLALLSALVLLLRRVVIPPVSLASQKPGSSRWS